MSFDELVIWYCRSASAAATTAVRSIADEEDMVESASSEAEQYCTNDVENSSVWTFSLLSLLTI